MSPQRTAPNELEENHLHWEIRLYARRRISKPFIQATTRHKDHDSYLKGRIISLAPSLRHEKLDICV